MPMPIVWVYYIVLSDLYDNLECVSENPSLGTKDCTKACFFFGLDFSMQLMPVRLQLKYYIVVRSTADY